MAASPAKVASSKPNPSTDGKPVQVKLVLLGEAAVGKSSVVLRFVQNDFQENKEPTIGAAFLTQKCRLEDKIIKFEIWDTAGQERFHSLAPMYYRNAQAAIVAYDITKSSSLDKAKSWVKELQRQGHANIVIALIGNKLDLVQSDADQSASNGSSSSNADDEPDDATATPDNATSLPDSTAANPNLSSSSKRQVTKEEAEAYAQENNLLFFETSAKTGEGIVEVFTQIAGKIPLEVILSGRGNNTAGGRAGAANRGSGGAGGTNNTEDSRINLANSEEAKKDGCAC
ncbi:hypothetical protein PGT21_019087 [Puccinia graminis f. sp. tritici]|uniref:Rab family protein n=3 Tax=Puccinia graminis f. sp. tritici TaxID=56615 RepID=E3JZY4_PUCGT|nr:rab family protein [Puccinia graminis f. sp. tritici CRL 75-36-700-3]EFP77609.2 rab family protein [Puccinia graminis f. sp. tritici CRL 75-36-700-3]KAA1110360.1 hypothetical protein PGT21_019087 [Puccinia graminis f. sp. tritici]